MALPGFSKFEQMFRAKLAVNAPVEVLKAKKQKEGLTEEEVGWAGGWKVGGVWRVEELTLCWLGGSNWLILVLVQLML